MFRLRNDSQTQLIYAVLVFYFVGQSDNMFRLRNDSQTQLIYAVLVFYFVGQSDNMFRPLFRPSSGPNNYVYILESYNYT